MASANRRSRPVWVAGGAASLGIGIWAMHFIGMMALHLPVSVSYDPTLTALSVVPALAASFIALYVLSWRAVSPAARWIASAFIGMGIVVMHYAGMAAMQMSPPIEYNLPLFALSVLVAICASWAALFIASRERQDVAPSFWRRLASSVIMGMAISGMHYIGMAAAEFAPGAICIVGANGLSGNSLAFFVGLTALVVLALALALTLFDELVGENSFYRSLLLAQSDAGEGVVLIESGRITYANQAMEALTGYTFAEMKALPSWLNLLANPSFESLDNANVGAGIHSSGRTETQLLTRDQTLRMCDMVLTVFWHARKKRHVLVCIDISERMAAQAALLAREKEARELALVASNTDNAVLITDALGHVTWVNDAYGQMTGYSLADVQQLSAGALLSRTDNDATARAVQLDSLRKGKTVKTEVLWPHKTGHEYWVALEVKSVLGEDGAIEKYIAIARDISERRTAEIALRTSEARLKEAQELAHVGSWEHDLISEEYFLSEEALRIHELASATGLLPRAAVQAVMHPQDLVELRAKRSQALATMGAYSLQLRLVFADGRTKQVHVRAAVVADAKGQPTRMTGTIQDITEQKQSELALVKLNEKLEMRVLERTEQLDQQRAFTETVLNSTLNLIFVVDQAGRLVRFNAACEKLSGYRFADIKGQHFLDLVIAPEQRQVMKAHYENSLVPGKWQQTLEVEWVTAKGERRLIAWANALVMDETGQMAYLVGTGVDITDRKRAELALLDANQSLTQSLSTLRDAQSQLVQSEKMASLGSLVAGISHEINTPVGVGLTAATALQEEFVQLHRDFEAGTMKRSELERFIQQGLTGYEILVKNLLRAADLIRSFKQVAVDQSSDAWRPVNLHDYVDEIVVTLQPRFKGRPVEVLNLAPPDLVVYTHPGAIYQILSNLLINSLVHAFEPEQAGVIQIDARQAGSEIQIDFSDNGKGIPEGIRQRIFDPFFTTRRGLGGSGLGLHIVFNLAFSTLKGSVALVNSAANGAMFSIRFPQAQKGAKQ